MKKIKNKIENKKIKEIISMSDLKNFILGSLFTATILGIKNITLDYLDIKTTLLLIILLFTSYYLGYFNIFVISLSRRFQTINDINNLISNIKTLIDNSIHILKPILDNYNTNNAEFKINSNKQSGVLTYKLNGKNYQIWLPFDRRLLSKMNRNKAFLLKESVSSVLKVKNNNVTEITNNVTEITNNVTEITNNVKEITNNVKEITNDNKDENITNNDNRDQNIVKNNIEDLIVYEEIEITQQAGIPYFMCAKELDGNKIIFRDVIDKTITAEFPDDIIPSFDNF